MMFVVPSLSFFLALIAGTAKAQLDCSQYQESVNVNDDIQLSYVVVVDDDSTGQGTLSAELVYRGLGWIGLGFSQYGQMVPSQTGASYQAVIGLPGDGVYKYDMTSRSDAGVVKASAQTLWNTLVDQNATHTFMRFTKALLEQNELSLNSGAENTLIWAYGATNTLGYHAFRGSINLSLDPCDVDGEDDSSPVVPLYGAPPTTAPVANSNAPIVVDVPVTAGPSIAANSNAPIVVDVPVTAGPSIALVPISIAPIVVEASVTASPTVAPPIPAPIVAAPLTIAPTIAAESFSPAPLDCGAYQQTVAINSGLQLSYVVVIDDATTGQGTLTAELVYTGLGWVGLGFSENDQMVPSQAGTANQAVIGLPGDNVYKYDMTGRSDAGVLLSPAQTLTNTAVEQNATHTSIRFTKALIEENEVSLNTGVDNFLIWAYGSSNTLGYHASRGVVTVMLNPCVGGDTATVSPSPVVDVAPTTVTQTGAPVTRTPTTSAPSAGPKVSNSTGSLDCSGFQQELELATGVTFRYTVTLGDDPTRGIMSAQLVYAGQAWIAIGISSNVNGAMVPADAVIGLPGASNSRSNPGKFFLSSRDMSGVTLLDDSRQTLGNHSIVQNDTHTVLTFNKMLIEANEVPIVLDTDMAFIWAYGSGNELGFHRNRGAIRIVVSACIPGVSPATGSASGASKINTPSTYQSLWSTHGVFAGVAWGIMSPLAIGSSLLRGLIPKRGLWFQIHLFLNMSVFIFTVVAFILAVVATQKGTVPGSSANHFTEVNHRTVGLAIMVCVALQVLGGMLRPHPPGKKANGEPEEKAAIRFIWEIVHKFSGYGLLACAWWQVNSGLEVYAARFGTNDLSPVFWGISGGIAGIIACIYFYIKCVLWDIEVPVLKRAERDEDSAGDPS